jgi:hypothetical protein
MREYPLSCKFTAEGNVWIYSTLQITTGGNAWKPYVVNFTAVAIALLQSLHKQWDCWYRVVGTYTPCPKQDDYAGIIIIKVNHNYNFKERSGNNLFFTLRNLPTAMIKTKKWNRWWSKFCEFKDWTTDIDKLLFD